MRRVLTIIPALVGLVVLAGWCFDIEPIERMGLASVSMNPMTAICFVLVSFAITLQTSSPSVFLSRTALALYAVVATIAAIKLFDVVAGIPTGIDTTFFTTQLEASRWHPNRMAPNTALCFLLVGASALLVTRQRLAAVISGQVLAITAGSVALFALVGYAFGVTVLYEMPALIPMAAHTCICFLFLCSAVLATTLDRGLMMPIADGGIAGRSARALLPAIFLVPLALGLLRFQGERQGFYPNEVGVALMITATILLLGAMVWWNSQHLLSVDRQRATAESALRALNDELEKRVAERTAEVERRERFLSALLANMKDGMIVNRRGKIVFANEACIRALGATKASDVIGRSPFDFVHPENNAQSRQREQILTTGLTQVPTILQKILCLDGREIEVEVTSASFMEGAEPVILSILRDVTDQKAMEKQLQHVQRMDAVGQLTGGIAHDFNNLLAVIIGNLDLLEGELKDQPRSLTLSAMALKASLRGAELTRQLLAFSRRQSLVPTTVDINALVNETTEMLRRTLGEKIDVEVRLADGLWRGLVDSAQTESAVTNLAINARDAMPNGGRLTIETANKHLDADYVAANIDVVPGDYVMIAVSDTGEGMPPDVLNRVFEPFFTTKSEGKGSGLGLSMIYGFIKQSRGHVKIYSEVGHGTTVRLYLPKSDVVAGAARPSASEQPVAVKAATVLVVEDNPDVRTTAAGQLTQIGYNVIEAENGPAAIQVLKADQPIDLLFTDIVMPGGMTGIELAAEAPKLRPGLKILLTSGFAEASMNGASDGRSLPILSKPYRRQDLAKKIREVLDERVS